MIASPRQLTSVVIYSVHCPPLVLSVQAGLDVFEELLVALGSLFDFVW